MIGKEFDWERFVWRDRRAWDTLDPDRLDPEVRAGIALIGAMVKRRRIQLKLTQAELGGTAGYHQSVISRLEHGRLGGMRFHRFATMVAAMGGLELLAPIPDWIADRHGWRRHGSEWPAPPDVAAPPDALETADATARPDELESADTQTRPDEVESAD